MTDTFTDPQLETCATAHPPNSDASLDKEMKEITVCGHKYFIDNVVSSTDDYDIFKVHDNFRREFGLKIFKNKKNEKEFVDCLNLLKDKPGIAAIFEFEQFPENVSVVIEHGSPVNVSTIPSNLLKRRMRQILTAVSSLSNSQLHFADISMNDFIETNGGIRLMNVESSLTNVNNIDETTFAPVVHLLREIVEGNRIKMDTNMYKEHQKCIATAKETKIEDSKQLLNSEIFRDCFKVRIHKSNRAMTPDPHNLVLMKKRKVHREVEEDYDEPVPIKKIIANIPSLSYVSFFGIGIFLSLLFVIAMQFTLKSSMTFTGMVLKASWVLIAVCGALLFATFKMVNDEDIDSIEYVANLKKWTRILVSFIILIIGGKILELGMESSAALEAASLGIWLITSLLL